jgi:serine/threonine protein kinase
MPGYPPTEHWIKLDEILQAGKSEYIALMLLSDTAKARTFLAANIDTLETVILKAGCAGVAGDASGRNMRDVLGGEFAILRALQGWPNVAPRPLDWVNHDWPVLVMEDFRGTHLCELPRPSRIECLPLLADSIAAVHEAGFVHGDIKLENTIRHHAGVGLIDFELAAAIGEPMRPAGTRGYIAPEVTGICPADTARDVFALAGCVAQAVLNIPLGLLPPGTKRLSAMLRNEGATEVAHQVEPWLTSNPSLRANAREVAATLHANVDRWRMIEPEAGTPSTSKELRWYRRASSDAAIAAHSFAHPGEHSTCWRNAHFMSPFECEAINIGAAGIILALLSIDTALQRTENSLTVDQGARWLTSRSPEGKAAGLFTGNAGVALTLALVGIRQGNANYLAAARRRFAAAALDRRELDLFSGAAGVIWAACLLHGMLDEDWALDAVSGTVEQLGQHATTVSNIPVWAISPERDITFFGCAHGSAGIAMALARWGQTSGETSFTDLARETFHSLARNGRTADLSALRIGSHDARHHAVGNWCHGVAGYLWALLNGLGDDPALRHEIDWAVNVLTNEMSMGTPTYCHGLSGQLELWHMLEEIPRYRSLAQARAGKVSRALRIMHVKMDGRCVWMSDDPEIITPDLWIGFLGPATALAMHVADIRHSLLSDAWLKACAQPSVLVDKYKA